MPPEAQSLRDFYRSPLGDLARRLIGRIIHARWLGAAGMTVAAVGYGPPYLDRFRDTAARSLSLMPAEQGAAIWPERNRCAVALVNAEMLPLPDNSVDRLLIAHALEAAQSPGALLEEVWRVVAAGRMGASRHHAIRSRTALFEGAASRSPAGRCVFSGVLGRSAVCAAD